MDRETWRAVTDGVAKSLTQLSDWTELKLTEEFIKLNLGTLIPTLTVGIFDQLILKIPV